jgi:hypothetical protein
MGRGDPMSRRVSGRCCGFVCAVGCTLAWAENPAETLELPQVEIVGATPLPGSGVSVQKLPANV